MSKGTVLKLIPVFLLYLIVALPACTTPIKIDVAEANKALGFPLLYLPNLNYQGAFVLSSAQKGTSSLHDAEGGMSYAPPSPNAPHGSMFVSGNFVTGGIAQFAIPPLDKTTRLEQLPVSNELIQPFASILDRSNPTLDYLSDLQWINNQLLYSAHAYYPASDFSKHRVGVVPDASKLTNFTTPPQVTRSINAFSGVEDASNREAKHSSGWFSAIPADWQNVLRGTHLFGPADGWSVAGRMAAGPSVFSFSPAENLLSEVSGSVIPSNALMDFTSTRPLDHLGLVGETKVNPPSDLWNSMSFVHFGFIFSGTRTLMLVGNHWGMDDDIGYKLPRSNGQPRCAGPCPFNETDQANYYWLVDLRDVVEASTGRREFDSIKPYAYGPINFPFQQPADGKNNFIKLVGGSYDNTSGQVYFQIRGADTRSRYEQRSIFVVYEADMSKIYHPPQAPKILSVTGNSKRRKNNPTFSIRCESGRNCKSSVVDVEWTPISTDTSGNSIKIDHYRVNFEVASLRYNNHKRQQRIGITVPGNSNRISQQLVPGDWKITVRAISDKNIPSKL